MTVANPVSQEVFSIRTFKVFEGYRWANTYEVRAQGSPEYDDLRLAAIDIADYERRPMPSAFRLYKVTISTYVPDSAPYNPESFTTVNLDLPGQAALSPELLPLGVCVFVRKNTRVGRPGKAFYRGYLSEGNVSWGGDRFTITPQRVDQIEDVLNTMLSAILARGFEMVLARGRRTVEDVRPVTGMVVTNRTSMKKLDNRYFDMRTR